MPPRRVLFRGARLVDPASGFDGLTDVLVEGSAVAAVGRSDAAGATMLDCDGLVVTPGLVDLHTHLREPGREDKETVETGARAAAVGGYTAITAMANTDPVADSLSVVQEVRHLGERAGLCEVHPVAAITKGLAGESPPEVGE